MFVAGQSKYESSRNSVNIRSLAIADLAQITSWLPVVPLITRERLNKSLGQTQHRHSSSLVAVNGRLNAEIFRDLQSLIVRWCST